MSTLAERLRCVTLNCWNLAPLGHPRCRVAGPVEMAAKIVDLGRTLRVPFPGHTPDLVVLSEVWTDALAGQVADAIAPGVYSVVWSGPPPGTHPGLAILVDGRRVSRTSARRRQGPHTGRGHPSSQRRCRWLACEFQLGFGSRAAFWAVGCHWKSWAFGGERATESDRMQSAREVGGLYLATRGRNPNLLVLGDLNCEPGDYPLRSQSRRVATGRAARPTQLTAFRQHDRVLLDGPGSAYLYGAVWQFAGEPDPLEDTRRAGYVRPRLMGTHGTAVTGIGTKSALLDHPLVSKRMMVGRQIELLERSVTLRRPVGGCSDHAAVSAEFRC